MTIDKQALGENLKRSYEAELLAMEREQLLSRFWAGASDRRALRGWPSFKTWCSKR